jgi:hypothetical protein
MERISRRKLVATGASAAAVAALAAPGAALAQQPRPLPGPGWWIFNIGLVMDSTVDALRTATGNTPARGPLMMTGTFYHQDDINANGSPRSGATPYGNWRFQGWNYGAGMLGIHSFNFFGLGELTATGTSELSVPVTGGTGTFRTVSGELRLGGAPGSANAVVEFELWGTTPGR